MGGGCPTKCHLRRWTQALFSNLLPLGRVQIRSAQAFVHSHTRSCYFGFGFSGLGPLPSSTLLIPLYPPPRGSGSPPTPPLPWPSPSGGGVGAAALRAQLAPAGPPLELRLRFQPTTHAWAPQTWRIRRPSSSARAANPDCAPRAPDPECGSGVARWAQGSRLSPPAVRTCQGTPPACLRLPICNTSVLTVVPALHSCRPDGARRAPGPASEALGEQGLRAIVLTRPLQNEPNSGLIHAPG